MASPKVIEDGRTVTVRVPISIMRRGGRKLVLAPNGENVTAAPVCRHIDKPLRDQSSCCIPVAPATSATFLQSMELAIANTKTKSVAYEIRTKSAQSEGSETNGPRERISGLSRCGAVRSLVRDARRYWALLRA
jgi:hypothetical protein